MYEEEYLCLDIPLLPCQVIPNTRAAQLPRRVLEQPDNLSMVCNNSAMLNGRHDKGNVHSRVIMLA